MKKIFSLLAAVLFAGSMFAAGAYNLTKVTSVENGGLYVFERNSHVLVGQLANDAVQTTDEYVNSGLAGNETYVWKLDAVDGKEGCFSIKNVAKAEAEPAGHIYLNNPEKTKITFSNNSTSDWKIEFTDGVALISNTSNSNRFLGETSTGSNAYKAYASQNLGDYGHDFTVYKLEESSDPYVSVTPATVDFGTVKKDASVDAKEVTVSFGNLTGAVTFSGLTAPFGAAGTIAASGDKITISASTAEAGEYSQTLTVQSAADSKSATVTVTMKVVEGADPSAAFELYTDAIVEGDYVICSDNSALNTTEANNRLGSTAVTPVNDVISGPSADIVWHIAKSGDYWTLYNADANKYAAAKTAKNQAAMQESGADDKALWTVTVSNGKFEFENKSRAAGTDPNNKWLRYNSQVSAFACYASGTGKALTLYKKASGAPAAVTKPVISGEANFQNEVTVTITCATEGAEIFYTLDGTEPTKDATKYTAAFKLTATTTVKAIAIKGEDKSSVVEKTFTKVEPLSCNEVYSKVKNDEVLLNDVTVTYANGKNVYVKDATGAMLVYLSEATTWKAGDVLSGVAGVVDIYYGLYEVKPSADQVAAVTATPGEAPAPVELTAAPVAADMNKYVILKDVTVSAATFTDKKLDATIGGETFVLRNNFNADVAFDTEKKYDITGVVAVYNDAVQLYFINAELHQATAVDNTAVDAKIVKAIRNGQVVLIRDGKVINMFGVEQK